MPEVEVDKETGEVKISMNKVALEKLEKAVETLEELKKQVPEAPKIEEVITAITEAKEKLLSGLDLEKVIKTVGGTETEFYVKFSNLTLDGEVTIKIAPRKKE